MALETAGYKYIVNLLKGETEADHTLQRKLLRLFTPAIMKDMNPKEFVDLLLEKDVITDADKEEIRCEGRNYGDIAASLMLLERVPKRVENWYEIFLEVLETCGLGHLVEYLKPDDTELYTMYPLTYPGPNVKPRSHPSSGSSLTLLTAERDRLEQQIQYWNQKRLLQIEVSTLQKDLQSLIEDQPSDTVPTKCAGNDLYLPKTEDKKADNDVCEIMTEPVAVAKTTQETELFQILNDLKNEIKQDFRVDIEDLKRYIATELVKNTSKYQKSDQTDVQMDHTADALGYIPAPTTHKMVRSASDSGLGSLPSSQFSWGVYNV